MCGRAVEINPWRLGDVPDHIKAKEMCGRAFEKYKGGLGPVPHDLKTQKMFNGAVRNNPYNLIYVPGCFMIQEMCEGVNEVSPWQLKDVPDHLKVQGMCNKQVWGYTPSLQYLPDWFVTQQQIWIWHDDDYYCNDDKLIKWYNGYKERKSQKSSIKEELMPIAWHSSRYWNWCISEAEKREQEKYGHKYELLCLVTRYKNFWQ